MANIQNFENLDNFEARREPEVTTAAELSQMAQKNVAMEKQGSKPAGTGVETQLASTGNMNVRKELGSAISSRETVRTQSGNTFSIDTTEGTQALAAAEAAKKGAQVVAEQKAKAQEMLAEAEQIKNADVAPVVPEIAAAESEFKGAMESANTEMSAEHERINTEEQELFGELGAEWASVMG